MSDRDIGAAEDALATVRAWNAAFAENDAERYFALVDPAITVWTPSNPYRVEGLAADREEFEHSLRRGTTRIGYFQMLHPSARAVGDVALVTYASRGSYGEAGKVAYLKETDVLVRGPGGWRILHVHVSATTGG